VPEESGHPEMMTHDNARYPADRQIDENNIPNVVIIMKEGGALRS
jgi:hypothetical protein